MTTFEEKGVPVPTYAVGDAVWVVTQGNESVSHPCPDCHGTKLWQATSPAGGTYTVECPRCTGGYSRFQGAHGNTELPSLSYRKTVYRAEARTVAGIEIRDLGHGDPISYKFGANQGYYNQGNVYPTEDTAKAVAALKQAEEDAKRAASPEATVAGTFSDITIVDATVKLLKDSHWDSWYLARHLTEEANNYLGPEGGYEGWTWAERAEQFMQEVEKRNPYIDYGPMVAFMDWLTAAAESGEIDAVEAKARIDKFNTLFYPPGERAEADDKVAA